MDDLKRKIHKIEENIRFGMSQQRTWRMKTNLIKIFPLNGCVNLKNPFVCMKPQNDHGMNYT